MTTISTFFTISEIIKSKFPKVKYINASELSNSDTGYFYPRFCEETVTKFVDEYGRVGYLFQTIIIDTVNESKKKSYFIIHERYNDSPNILVYTGDKYFYNDCIIQSYDKEKFIERFTELLNGNHVKSWNLEEKDGTFEIVLKNDDIYVENTVDSCFLQVMVE